MIIAIDGPAGSGKSTVAREVAKSLGMRYLDTGAMYRAVALLALEAGLLPDRVAEAGTLAQRATIRLEERPDDLVRVFIGDREVTQEIRTREVSQAVSPVSADPSVRGVLTRLQRAEAHKGDVVLEGRDMGTVVAPDADLKIYLTAGIEERARRRGLQQESIGISQPAEEIIADIALRDAYDSGRELAPLKKAPDAVEIDTTGLTIDEVVGAVRTAVAAATAATAAPATASSPSIPVKRWPVSRMIRGPLDTLLYRIAFSFLPPLWRRLFRMDIAGAHNIPLSGPVVLASNHRSNLDPFFLGVSVPRQIHFMAKAELWKVRPLGNIVSKMGAFPISRGSVDRAAVAMALKVIGSGEVLGIFPEGRRQPTGVIGDIHPGVTLFSLREGVVTIPVLLEGTEYVARGGLPVRLPRVRVRFGPPLQLPGPEVCRGDRAKVAGERLTEALRALSNPEDGGA